MKPHQTGQDAPAGPATEQPAPGAPGSGGAPPGGEGDSLPGSRTLGGVRHAHVWMGFERAAEPPANPSGGARVPNRREPEYLYLPCKAGNAPPGPDPGREPLDRAEAAPVRTPAGTRPPNPPSGLLGGAPDRTAQAPGRSRFDTLFIDPRHIRGDCRMVRTALRLGRVAPDDVADLLARLANALRTLDADNFASRSAAARAKLAAAAALFGVLRDALDAETRATRYMPGQTRGRPRTRG